MKTKRICIYPKDIALLTGKSSRQAERLLNQVRVDLKKNKNQWITIEEFAVYIGIDITVINHHLLSLMAFVIIFLEVNE